MKITLCVCIACIGFLTSRSQTTLYPMLAMEVETTPAGIDTTVEGYLDFSDSTIFNSHMIISLFDTLGISKIHVTFKNSLGDIILQKYFSYDTFGSFPDGTSYSRNEFLINLDFGNFPSLLSFYSDVKIELANGSFTDLVGFSH
jgi:hypothetical protein